MFRNLKIYEDEFLHDVKNIDEINIERRIKMTDSELQTESNSKPAYKENNVQKYKLKNITDNYIDLF